MQDCFGSLAHHRIDVVCWGLIIAQHETLYEKVKEETKKQETTMGQRTKSAMWSKVSTEPMVHGSNGNSGEYIKSFEDFHLVKVVNQLIGTVLLGKGMVQPDDVFKVIGRSIKDDTGRVSNAPLTKLKKDRAFQDLLVW